jgi:hypothetical protein
MRLQVKDDSGGRAFLLLQDEWATQCTGLQKDDTLIISGAFLRAVRQRASPPALPKLCASWLLQEHDSLGS